MVADSPSRLPWILSIIAVTVGCAVRLIWPEADPDYYAWEGYIIDEGRWIENVRAFLLGHGFLDQKLNIHLMAAPAFQAVSLFVFFVLDISRWTVRLFPMICGCAVLILFWSQMRSVVGGVALVTGTALLATQEDLVMLSRVGIPEMPAMLCELAVFALILRASGNGRLLLGAGVLMLLGIGMKATTLPMAFVFGLCVLLTHEGNRLRSLAMFYAPAAITGIATMFAVVAFAPGLAAALLDGLPVFARFLSQLQDLYSVFDLPFSYTMAPTLNVLLIGVWIGMLYSISVPSALGDLQRRWLKAAAVWAFSYVPLVAALEYYPERYMAHALVPLIIIASIATHIVVTTGLTRLVDGIGKLQPAKRMFVCAMASVPLAILLAPLALPLLAPVLGEGNRLSSRIFALAVAWLVLSPLVSRGNKTLLTLALILPLGAFPIWLAGHRLWGWEYWADFREPAEVVRHLFIVLGGAVAFLACWHQRLRWAKPVFHLYVMAVVAATILPYSRLAIEPTYTLRDVSRALAMTITEPGGIMSHEAEGLFVDNTLEYQSHFRWADAPAETVVSFELPGRKLRFTRQWYCLRQSYALYVSPRYSDGPAEVNLYRLGKPQTDGSFACD